MSWLIDESSWRGAARFSFNLFLALIRNEQRHRGADHAAEARGMAPELLAGILRPQQEQMDQAGIIGRDTAPAEAALEPPRLPFTHERPPRRPDAQFTCRGGW